MPPVFTHYDVRPVIDVYGNVDGRDLVGIARFGTAHRRGAKDLTRGNTIVLRGQAKHARQLSRPGRWIVDGLALIYLLLVVNFQSWLDPFIIITALPGALLVLSGHCSCANDL